MVFVAHPHGAGLEEPISEYRTAHALHSPPGVVHGATGRMRVLVVGVPDISDEDLFFPDA